MTFTAIGYDQRQIPRVWDAGRSYETALAQAEQEADDYRYQRPDLRLRIVVKPTLETQP